LWICAWLLLISVWYACYGVTEGVVGGDVLNRSEQSGILGYMCLWVAVVVCIVVACLVSGWLAWFSVVVKGQNRVAF